MKMPMISVRAELKSQVLPTRLPVFRMEENA